MSTLQLTITAELGGDPARHWATSLLAMYRALAQQQGWGCEVEATEGNEMYGYRYVVLRIDGEAAWPCLREDHGRHRWLGVDPDDDLQRPLMAACSIACLRLADDAQPVGRITRSYNSLHKEVRDERLPQAVFAMDDIMAGRGEALYRALQAC